MGVLSFGGFALGAFLGTRLGPLLLPQGSSSPYAPAFGLLGALLGRGDPGERPGGRRLQAAARARSFPAWACSTGCSGRCCGARWRWGSCGSRRPWPPRRPARDQLRADIQRSAILRKLNEVLPPSGADPRTRSRGWIRCRRSPAPSPDVAAPEPRIAHTRRPSQRAARSVVRVDGTACGLAIEGSGWVAAPDMVVTNAHVVAGEQDTTVRGRRAAAEPAGAGDRVRSDATTSRCCACPDLGLPR